MPPADQASSEEVEEKYSERVNLMGGACLAEWLHQVVQLTLGCEVARVGVSPLMHRHPLARLTPMRRDRLNLPSSRCRRAA